ncbi:MAG: hypothetical protein JXB39_09205 [Deltaproteobacteria bacterium]|nr:hypothetical protein [Deltaproteobacteria bacterium]
MTHLLLLSLLVAPTDAAPLTADERERRDALLSSFEALFTPADTQAIAAEVGQPACVTGLVAQLKDDWGLFSPAERARITERLTPWKADLLDDPPYAAAVPGHEHSCLGEVGAYHLLGEHFVVEWDSSAVAGYAERFLESLEYAWEQEVETFGWKAPTSAPEYPILAYIYDYSSYAGAYTSVEWCSGYGYVPYIVAYSGSFSWESWAQDMAAHEFNHTIQFSTSMSPDFWYWEATAVWMQEEVYPSHNIWSDYVVAYTEYPWIGQNAWSQQSHEIFYHMYGMAIFNFYLSEYHGGHAVVRDMWGWAADHTSSYMEEPIWNVAEGLGLDWEELMDGFMSVVTVMDFADHRYFPDVRIQDAVTELPSSGTSGTSRAPQSLGQNFVLFDDGLFGSGEDLRVTFDGDDAVPWFVILVAEDDGEIEETVKVEVDDLGVGEAWITPRGGDVWLVVSPWDVNAYGTAYNWDRATVYTYGWSAELGTEPEDTGTPDDTGIPDTDPDLPARPGDGDDDEASTCGCASTPSTGSRAALAGLLLAATILLWRRRS